MKTKQNKTKQMLRTIYCLFLMMIFILPINGYAQQTITINSTFTTNSTVYTFSPSETVYSLTIDGSSTLNSNSSLVRVILVDNSNIEHLIYESYSLLHSVGNHAISSYGDETMYLNGISLGEIKVEIENASITLNSFYYSTTPISSISNLISQHISSISQSKIDALNQNILLNGATWYAGETNFSNLSYEEKKSYFPGSSMPNLNGLEYYVGGYFSIIGENVNQAVSGIVDHFDWRDRHGSNIPGTQYYNYNGYGWIPPRPQGQGGADCWAFAPVYTLESVLNLYYNFHENTDLSEQDAISCSGGGTCHNGGWPETVVSYMKSTGIVNESCFPYIGCIANFNQPCSLKCATPLDRIKITDDVVISGSGAELLLKQYLITNGPLSSIVFAWGHAMSMVGYGVVKEGDLIMNGNATNTGIEVTVPHGSPDIGKPYYIFKQSWGGWGINNTPFINVIIDVESSNKFRAQALTTPLINTVYPVQPTPAYHDYDGDGYYWWGIGDRPAGCPTTNPQDCDDSDPYAIGYNSKYECIFNCSIFTYNSTQETISSSTTIGNANYDHDIIIQSPAVVTIEGIVNMHAQAKIVVEPGAKLIIDGGEITNPCEQFWKGIEVWGNKDEPQTYDSQTGMPIYQGEVIIKNGGTIRNSVDGIMAIGKDYNNGEYLWEYTGGIIKARDANFINNNNSIWIGGYTNYHPDHWGDNNYIRPNRSKIIDCHFENDEFMLPGHTGYSFIGLCDVDDISIAGNKFINSTQNPTINRGRGIVSYGASYNVNALCDVSTTPFTYQNNHFEGLYYGIWTSNDPANTDAIVDIDRADFEDVYHGIHLIGTKNAKVTRCNFQISEDNPASSYTTPYGIFLKGSDGYTIEENNFTKNSDLTYLRGIVIENSGNNDNEIYNNIFTDLHVAIQPQYDNRNNQQGGLKLFCNDMDGYIDVFVPCNDASEGIAEAHQISNSGGIPLYLPAGDKFTSYSTSCTVPYNIANGGGIIQYLSTSTDAPNCVTDDPNDPTHNVIVDNTGDWGSNPECPSKIISGGDNISTLYSELSSARIALNSSELILNIWENGGDANLEQEVETTQPWDVYVQFNDLLAESPYLSDDVLMAIIDNSAFTSLMIELLMIANPQASHNDEIMQAIYDRIPAMPQSYIDAILAGGDNVSQLEILEGNVAADRHLLNTIGNNIKRVYRTDTINIWSTDSIIAFVSRENTLEGKYELASIYLGLGQFENMNSTLNSISTSFELDEDETTDLANWQSYFTIAQTIQESDVGYNILNQTQIEFLETYLNLNRPGLSEAALSLLLVDNPEYNYHEIVLPFTESEPRYARPANAEDKSENQSVLKVYPNPSHNYITLEYRTGDQYSNLWFTISDVNGKEIIKQQLLGGDNEEIVNISILRPDIYTVILYGDAQIIANERITVLK